MADIRPILLSTLAALDKIHSQDRLLNTKELDTFENIRFNSKWFESRPQKFSIDCKETFYNEIRFNITNIVFSPLAFSNTTWH